jgi:hypothetical protein
MAATARPKPVRSRLEPRLPLRPQRVDHPSLLHPARITGIPSGRCFPLALGMHTRLTGLAFHGAQRRCTQSTSLALDSSVNTVRPSTPAV